MGKLTGAANVLASKHFAEAEVEKRLTALTKDVAKADAVREVVRAHGSSAEDKAYAYIEQLPWDKLYAGEVIGSPVFKLLMGVTEHAYQGTPRTALAIDAEDLVRTVKAIGRDERGDLGKLAATVARYAQRGNEADLAALRERVRASKLAPDSYHWNFDFRSSLPERRAINERLYEIIAARFASLEQHLDAMLLGNGGSASHMYVAATVLARQTGHPAPSDLAKKQSVSDLGLRSLLTFVRLHDTLLLAKYSTALKLFPTRGKEEKASLDAEFAKLTAKPKQAKKSK